MDFLSKLFGSKESSLGSAQKENKISGSIKTVYSFVGASIPLDATTPIGKAIVNQIHPYALQNLRQGDAEFARLFTQVEKENSPHVLGTGTSKTSEGLVAAFTTWLKSRGVNIIGTKSGGKTFIFSGNAQHPESRLSFSWTVFIYIEFGG